MSIDLTKYVNKIIPPDVYVLREPLKPLFKIEKGDTKVFIASRSVGKSYTMGAIALLLARLQSNLKIGYFLPTDQQIKITVEETFNRIINNSPQLLLMYSNISLGKQRVYMKKFKNNSVIYFRHQIVKTEDEKGIKIRGAHPDVIIFDECQDLHYDFVDKIRPTIISSKYGIEFYAGTFKTEYHLSYDMWYEGTRHEYMVICPNCKAENFATRENIDYDNISYGPFCIKCKTQLTRKIIKENGKLVQTNPNGKYFSLRLSSLFAYWIPWKVIEKQKLNTYEAFVNEIVGEPIQLQDKIITENDIRKNCENYDFINVYDPTQQYILFAGIDWAGDMTYTVLTILGYKDEKFYVLFVKKYTGTEGIKNTVHLNVEKDLMRFRPVRIFGDWGMGLGRNSYLESKGFPIFEFEFTGGDNPPKYSESRGRFIGSKYRLMEMFIKDLKSGKIKFPRYEIIAPFIREYTSYTRTEYKSRREPYLTYEKEDPEALDDSFMSLILAYGAAITYLSNTYIGSSIETPSSLDKIYGIYDWDIIV
jgi:hypothetical protein